MRNKFSAQELLQISAYTSKCMTSSMRAMPDPAMRLSALVAAVEMFVLLDTLDEYRADTLEEIADHLMQKAADWREHGVPKLLVEAMRLILSLRK